MSDTFHPDNTHSPVSGAKAEKGSAPVFVSYSSLDSPIAEEVCAALESEGYSCWIAPRDVVPGEFYADAIVRAIDSATVVLLVLSLHSNNSPHVVREIERATSKRRPVLALRIDHVQMQPALEYFLNASHWLDATVSGVTGAMPRIIEAVRRFANPHGNVSEAPKLQQSVPPVEAPSNVGQKDGANSIAVLPFANMSADPDQEYFSDGLAEEVINLLSHVPGLKVIARTSAFAFRGKNQDVREIAAALGVTHLLEGSVRRSGNRLRITGQLIHAADGTHVWSERFDRELSDIFAIQDEISTAIVDALRVKLGDGAGTKRYAPNLAAYEIYLKARHLANSVAPSSLELARQCFEQAIQLDRAFPLAHIGIGNYWISVMIFGRCPAHKAVPAARAAAREALTLDPSLPEAHALLGLLAAMYDFDWTAAEHHFDFPKAKLTSFATFRPTYGWFQFMRGNTGPAILLAQSEIDADPLDVWPRMNLQVMLQWEGRTADALEQLKKVLEIDENQVVAMVAMALIAAEEGDLAQALTIARRAHAVAPWYLDATAVLAALLRRHGEVDASLPLSQLVTDAQEIGDAPARALFHLLCGEVNQAADWAERAIEERDLSILIYLRFVVSRELRASQRWPNIASMLKLRD
ncbi:MAG: TIR domain-containing protein [Pseudomonadota bacterium]|nr:TIR domain-containing protein [Pseudomonadota bacterium]